LRLKVDFISETMETSRPWGDIHKVLKKKKKKTEARILSLAKLSFKSEDECELRYSQISKS
jgi:hypothetical protein